MKTTILLFVSLVLLAVQGWAAPVDESAAMAIVQDFIVEKRGLNPNSVPTASGIDFQLVHAEMSSVNVMQNAYYIYNTGDGFVIVAGDDRAEQILGYGDEDLDMEDIPCCLQFMLDSYKEQIDFLFEHPGLVVETPSMNAPRLTATNVSPMLTAKWGQRKPYYNLTPVYNGTHCKTGCSCVALCQVMHYWKYPTVAVPSLPSYVSSFRNVTITVPELPSDRFHWNYIKDSYSGSYTADEAYSIAKLMRYVGQAEYMGYSPDASGASTWDILNAAILFGYNHNAEVIYKSDYSNTQWASKIQSELSAGRPIVYAGFNSSNTVGHSFNIDGYRASDKKYHMNWGFRGNANGYYALNAFNPLNNNFNYRQQMIVGLVPQAPEIVVNPASLSFTALSGETKTATFTVRGYALTGDLTVKLNNGGSTYSIDKTSITMSDAAHGTQEATVKVTYKPTVPGTSSASVTISGGGATAKKVSLSGTANPVSTINVNPSSLSFNAVVGETKTATFTVKCPYATSNLSLKLNNGGSIYSIDKTSISKSAAINGATVTVTYNPSVVGTSTASVTISGGGANPYTVPLSGTAAKPEITVNPSSLSFETRFIETKTATINVKGFLLTGNLSLELIDTEGIYSIDKTTISKSDAMNGATVTVSYSPTTSGSSYASLIIRGGGAEPTTVSINGNAFIPEIKVTPISLSFNALVGETKTKSFIVQGVNLVCGLELTLNDEGGIYSIDKTSISKSDAIIGDTVTVTYRPIDVGASNANVTISGGGYSAHPTMPKTINLNGNAMAEVIVTTDVSEVTIDPTYTGYEGTRTIQITATNLLSDLQLSLTHDNTNSFGLSKYTITPEDAAAGAFVKVYFYPTTGGGKHATLNIKSEGAETVSIPVRGTGIKSDGYIFASPTNLSFETLEGIPVTQTFKVTYTYPNGSVMISKVNSDDETAFDSEGSNKSVPPTLNASSHFSDLTRVKIPFDSIIWRPKVIIDSIPFVLMKSLVLELAGDDCFDITPKRIRLSSVPCSTYVTVTYHPDCIGEHDSNIKIWLFGGSAKPFILPLHGTATAQFNYDNEGNDLMITQSGSSINSLVNEMLMSTKVYAEGQNIIIESPVEQSAIISDISGHAQSVNLYVGRNEIPVNASGIYIVRIREKVTKLMLK